MPDNTKCRPTAFASKRLSNTERWYNIKGEALGILHGLEKFHHYCLTREVSIITDHKWLNTIFKKKDVTTLSQCVVHTAQNSPMQNTHYIKPRPTSIHNWLAIQDKIILKTKMKKLLAGRYLQCHQGTNRHSYMHVNTVHTRGQQKMMPLCRKSKSTL